jgi:hypothetical protein
VELEPVSGRVRAEWETSPIQPYGNVLLELEPPTHRNECAQPATRAVNSDRNPSTPRFCEVEIECLMSRKVPVPAPRRKENE